MRRAFISAVYQDFLEHWEIDTVGCLRVFVNLLVCAGLLPSKLVTREGQNLETLVLKLGVELN